MIIIISINNIKKLKSTNFGSLGKENLVNLKDINIDINTPKQQRIEKYFDDIKNPYLFISGDLVVHIEYGENDISLQQKIENIIKFQ